MIALGVGVWENVQARRHARLSAQPALEYIVELKPGDVEGTGRVSIRVVNEGIGPAVIETPSLRLKSSDGLQRFRSWSEATPALRTLGFRVTGRSEISEGSVLGIGRERHLVTFELEGDPDADHGLEPFNRLLERLNIVIASRSIYGDPFEARLDR